MHKKPVIASTRAELDIDEALAYYIEQGSRQAALGFIDALEQAYQHIAHQPDSGSLRYAIELDLPELRFWMLNGYPYLIFYVNQQKQIEIWRVLHAQRDIPFRLNH